MVWDRATDPQPGPEPIVCWQSYFQAPGVTSVPRYLEEHAERIRRCYLAFVHDLGEFRIAGRRIVDHLELVDGLSFWWQTQVAEKSPLKSPRIYDCLRLICLEEMLRAAPPPRLTLLGADRALAAAIGRLCANLRIEFRFDARPVRRIWSPRRVYESLPYALRGLLSLRHVAMRWPLRRARPREWFSGESALFICSYFIHLDPALCAGGQFHSRQWEDLPGFLQTRGNHINWLQLFLFSSVVPTVARGLAWLHRFNADSRHQGSHAFLDSYLSLGRVARALWLWLRLCRVAWRLRGVSQAFYPQGSRAWLWPLLAADWQASLSGPIGLSNCLAVVLFDAALADVPRQRRGLYLCENQAWEKALLHAWRTHGHGEIVGVQHATAPFWHLYYFEDPRSLAPGRRDALPLPDRLAVNGAQAHRTFSAAGFPADKLVEVEALRYLHVAGDNVPAGRLPVADDGAAPQPVRTVLILGDIVPASVHHLLSLVEAAAALLQIACSFTFKPHPGYAADLAAYPALRVSETREALGRILRDYDVAVAANSTSAAVDAYVAGVPVIIALDGDSLNLSPLRGRRDARFVSTAQELADALQASPGGRPGCERSDFFFLDADLRRWRQLLALA